MRGLTQPPKKDTAGRAASRVLFLLILAIVAGLAIYATVINQRIPLVEDTDTDGLELGEPSVVDGLTINVVEDEGGPTPVVFLHDIDVTGGLVLADASAALPGDYRGVRVDRPGYGYSDRLPFETQLHTAAGQAEIIAGVLADRFTAPVIVVGIGFGGDVAADLAYSYPDLVSGLVLVDTDFDATSGFVTSLQTLPWVGTAATFTWETGGRFALDNWSPHCAEGGWCPTPDQVAMRSFITSIQGSTETIFHFRRTPEAALAPANLADLRTPIAYVWSTNGSVSSDTVDELEAGIPGMSVIESVTFQAHLEEPSSIASAISALQG